MAKRKPFCPQCGKIGSWGLCEDCRGVKEKVKEVKICNRCKHYLHRDKWKPFKNLEFLVEGFRRRGIQIKLKKTTCGPCLKYASGYFESIIQLRTKNYDVQDLLFKVLDKEKTEDRMAFYRLKPRKHGLDVEIGSKRAAKKAIRSLKTFHLKTKQSRVFRGMKGGRRIFYDVFLLYD